MTEVDTSSYAKATMPVAQSPLEIAKNLGSLQSQQLGISQQKLDQTNQALTYMTRAMGSVGPEGTKKQYFDVAQNAVNMGLVPQNMLNTYAERLQAAPTAQAFYNEAMTAMATHKEQLDYHLGQQGSLSNGQTIQPTLSSPKPGFGGVRSSGMPIQIEPPPTAPVVDTDTGQQGMFGGQNLPLAPGRVRSPGALPVGPIPGVQGQSNNFGGNVVGATAEAPTPAMTPKGPATAVSPGFAEGLAQRTEDQNLATNKMTGIKPLLLAYPKMLELERSGPGTQTWNDGVAFLKTWGVLPIGVDGKDQTQVFQEINKYMNQYISRGGNRSDSEQAQKEMSNPNVTKQILPALKELSAKTAGQDRIEAARANAFEKTIVGKDGKEVQVPETDMSKYGAHKSTFPQSMSVDAASFDFLPKKERDTKYKEMRQQALDGNSNAIRFMRTLDTMRKQKMHGEMQVP